MFNNKFIVLASLALSSVPNVAIAWEYCSTDACRDFCKNNVTVNSFIDSNSAGENSYCTDGTPCTIRKAINNTKCELGGPSTIHIPAGYYALS